MRRPALLAIAFAVAGALFAVDALTKLWAEDELSRAGARSYLGGHLVLRLQNNTGIAFGLFQPHLHPRKRQWLIAYGAAVSLGLAAVIVWQTQRLAATTRGTLAGLTAMLGGAVGNLHDRVFHGAVIDFISLPTLRWPAFNLADLWLAVGLVLCAVALIRSRR